MDHAALAELIAARAIDALEPHERELVDEHVRSCPICAAELVSMQSVAVALAHALPAVEPPPELRARVLEAARADAASARTRRRRRLLARSIDVRVAAALAACAAIALVIALGVEYRGGSASAPRASLTVAAGGTATLTIRALDPAPAGSEYEAWVIGADAVPRPAGFFTADGGSARLVLRRPVVPGNRVAVTLERGPGRDRPAGRALLTIDV